MLLTLHSFHSQNKFHFARLSQFQTFFSVSTAPLQLISASFGLKLLIRQDVVILKVCLSFENPLFHSSKNATM